MSDQITTIARYLAVAGAHVTIHGEAADRKLTVSCEGCGPVGRPFEPVFPTDSSNRVLHDATVAAQHHAETCRRIPERLWPKDGAR